MFCDIPEFGRCCFCMPLRTGVLVWGVVNILFSALMVGVYSYSVHHDIGIALVYHGVPAGVDEEICIAIFCVDFLFNILLVYGAHKKIILYMKIYYYYTIATVVAAVILELITLTYNILVFAVELWALSFAGLSIHLYLLFLVRSLLKKMEISGHTYENQLHQFVNGEHKDDENHVLPNETA